MRYFAYGTDTAAVEDAGQAERYRASGWVEVDRTAFVARWRVRDLRALARIRAAAYDERIRLEAQAQRERACVKGNI